MTQPDHITPPRRSPASVWWLLAGALALRVVVIPAPGWELDVTRFGWWMRAAVEHGVAQVSEVTWCNYPPGYLYLLKAVGLLWMWITRGPIPPDGSLALRALVKLIPIVSDLAGAWFLYRLAARTVRPTRALMVLGAYAYNPALWFNSAVWGQADSLVAVMLLASVWALSSQLFALAFAVAAATILVKLQAVVVVPILVLAAYRTGGLRGLFAAARGAVIAVLILVLPFVLGARMNSLIDMIFNATGWYPYVSMNAHNVWWLVAGMRSPGISDAMRVGNALLTYHTLGTAMLAIATLLIGWRLWGELAQPTSQSMRQVCETIGLQLMAFYLLPTQMHERYIVPALIFAAVACVWTPRFWWVYGVISAATFVSLATTLNVGYPLAERYPRVLGRVIGLLPASRGETYAVSVLLIAAFVAWFLHTPDRGFRGRAALVAGLCALVLYGVAHIPLHAVASIADWEPVQQSQEWGTLQHNRSVDRQRLSVSGFVFRRGIGTHATSHLTYHLRRAFRRFDTLFGIDDEANRGQRVRFRVLVDERVSFDSGPIAGLSAPRHLRIPVDGAEFLTLEVLDGGDGINSDHADWLEPVLSR
ncbi:MAG TPA: NPCBM/NEW2 domain-containing protein [Candidatus Binatia bacterium]|nr:NPCBM/NEW2 domain-containing protein [Candidatus Binatia bacterium]